MPQDFEPSYTFSEDRLNELKQLFPEAFEDGVFNVDTLKELIGEFSTDNKAKEHFGLNWVGKQDARRIASKPPTGTLKPCIGEGVNEENTENIFIEGDNLEVLKILRKSYSNRIKLCLIDPPYNTGSDLVYKDTFADSTEDYLRKTGEKSDEGLLVSNPKSSGKFHGKWMNFIYPRLRVAKDLLAEEGVILIHIDENEYVHLVNICNELFGKENDLGTIIWDKKNPKGEVKGIANQNEFIVCYAKNKDALFRDAKLLRSKKNAQRILSKAQSLFKNIGKNDLPEDLKKVSKKYKLNLDLFNSFKGEINIESVNNSFKSWIKGQKEFSGGEKAYNEIDEKGRVFQSVSMAAPDKPETRSHRPLLHPFTKKPCPVPAKGWRYPDKTMDYLIEQEMVIFGKDENSQPRKKYILEENMFESIPSVIPFGGSDEKLFKEFNLQFDNPKPHKFISEIIRYFSTESDIILDFFGGSGTTAHSVMESIENDNINRKYILVQIDEKIDEKKKAFKDGYKNISEITQKRINLSIAKYPEKNFGYRKFKQFTSTIYKWQDFNPDSEGGIVDLFSKLELDYKNPLLDGVQTQDFIAEIILQEGFPLTANQEEVLSGVFKITHEWIPYTLYASMLYSFKDSDFTRINLTETDHFVCLDKAFEGNDSLKQMLDNQCKLYTI